MFGCMERTTDTENDTARPYSLSAAARVLKFASLPIEVGSTLRAFPLTSSKMSRDS